MTDKLKAIILEHIKKYPQAELQDILKLLYQNEFGPKHLANNEIEAFKSLSKEINSVEFDKNEPLFEDIGDNALRLNLKAIPAGTNLNYINKAIINSANEFYGTNEKLVVKFGLLVVMAQNNEIPFDIERAKEVLATDFNNPELLLQSAVAERIENEKAMNLYNKIGFLPVKEISKWYRVK